MVNHLNQIPLANVNINSWLCYLSKYALWFEHNYIWDWIKWILHFSYSIFLNITCCIIFKEFQEERIPEMRKRRGFTDWSHSFLRQQRQQSHNFFRFYITINYTIISFKVDNKTETNFRFDSFDKNLFYYIL